MSRLSLLLVFALLVVVGFASGCDDEEQQCRINSDCSPEETCVQGQCLVQCREQRDCPSAHFCNAGRCEPLSAQNCSEDGDCRFGERCVSGVCQVDDGVSEDTAVDSDASNDTAEDTGQPDTNALDLTDTMPPQDTQDTAPPQDTQDTTPPPDTTPPTDTTPPPDTSADTTDTSCPPQSGVYGDLCQCPEQCVSGLCIGNPTSGVGVCTQTCAARAQCNGGQDACITVGPSETVCSPDNTGASCETAGVPDPSKCIFQTCVQTVGGLAVPQHFCSMPCGGAADCKPDHACSPVICQDLGGGALQCVPTFLPWDKGWAPWGSYTLPGRFCVPINQPNACQTNQDAETCPSGLCDASTTLCTGQCLDPVDCPFGTCINYCGDASCPQYDPRAPIGYCGIL